MFEHLIIFFQLPNDVLRIIGIRFLSLSQRYILLLVCKKLHSVFSSLVPPVWQLSFFNLDEMLVPLAKAGYLKILKYFSLLKFPVSRSLDELATAAAEG